MTVFYMFFTLAKVLVYKGWWSVEARLAAMLGLLGGVSAFGMLHLPDWILDFRLDDGIVDVNERALDLVRSNASELGLANVNAVLPGDVPDDVVFRTIRSNPPIRVGKDQLHGLLEEWIPRLDERSDAWLVVSRNLGSDSLQRWMATTFHRGYSVHRSATAKGFRVLRVRRHGSTPTAAIDVV